MRRIAIRVSSFVSILTFCLAGLATASVKIDSNTFGALEARAIGPAVMSGRIMALDAVAADPRIVYVGAASGGVWKSKNGGTTFEPVFDKNSQSIGSITIDQSHPDTVWVGTGEADTRNSSSIGTGIYKSTDAGESWQIMGLEKSERISKIAVDPKDSNTVYAAATGALWSSSEDRGVYKSTDGGKTWQKVLYVNADTGCSDLAIDPQEPKIVYASMWQFRRKAYFFTSGGPGSGLYKSIDAGKTWKKLTNGLPAGDLGRIAIAVAPTRSSIVYANVESKKTALYKSEDMGESWTAMNTAFNVQVRPFYFSHLYVDPKDYNRIYKPGFTLSSSDDGGQSMSGLSFGGYHPDLHALWINPNNPSHMLLGTDGGVYVTYDRTNTWIPLQNLPVSQFYHVAYDMEQPYNVYGGLQDNGSWRGPSESTNGIQNKDWESIGFGDGFHIFPDPTDKDLVFWEYQGGNFFRYRYSTKEIKDIKPSPKEGEAKYRFNWNTAVSTNKKNPGTIYIGGQFLFRTADKGESWEKISPDLTTNDPEKQKQEDSGGITVDNSNAENHCTIVAIGSSPLDENLIWAGTDDGNLQLTQDGGKSWTNVVANVPDLPRNTWCSSVEASRYDASTAYATFDNHQTGDMKPYIYKTTDYGKSWKAISSDAIKGYAHVIREDLVDRDLLFAGTEFGLYLSIDGGQNWAQFTGKFPKVAVRDIAIHPREGDLIIATHGRGLYIVDDISPLRQLTPQLLESKVAFLEGRPAVIRFPRYQQDFPGNNEFVGANPPEAATIVYYLKDRHVVGDLKLEIYDAQGNKISTLPATGRRGINRATWYMRLKAPRTAPSPEITGGLVFGPSVGEGTYTVKLIKGDETFSSQVKVINDPTLTHSAEDRKLQQDTVMSLYQMQDRLSYVSETLKDARDQANSRAQKESGQAKALKAYADKLEGLRKIVVATKEGFLTGEEQLREEVINLYQSVSAFGGRPSQSQLERLAVLEKRLQKAESDFAVLMGKDLAAVNSKLKEPIKVLSKEEWSKKEL